MARLFSARKKNNVIVRQFTPAMYMLFPDIPKQQDIRLRAEKEPHKAFYRLMIAERTFVDGLTVRSELSKLIHTAFSAGDQGQFNLSLETFDARRRDSEMSLSIKDLLSRAERCYQDLDLVLDEEGQISEIQNLARIMEIWTAQKQYLAERFNGPGIQALDQFEDRVLQSGSTLARYLGNDRKLGLLLNIPYGTVGAAWMPGFTTRTNNFMEGTVAFVRESFRLHEVNEIQIQIEGNGQLVPGLQQELFRSAMQRNHQAFHPVTDKPALVHYNRNITLDTATHRPLTAGLIARFEFGKNYAKEIDYQLTAVSADDI